MPNSPLSFWKQFRPVSSSGKVHFSFPFFVPAKTESRNFFFSFSQVQLTKFSKGARKTMSRSLLLWRVSCTFVYAAWTGQEQHNFFYKLYFGVFVILVSFYRRLQHCRHTSGKRPGEERATWCKLSLGINIIALGAREKLPPPNPACFMAVWKGGRKSVLRAHFLAHEKHTGVRQVPPLSFFKIGNLKPRGNLWQGCGQPAAD